jgi:hypothetical protein
MSLIVDAFEWIKDQVDNADFPMHIELGGRTYSTDRTSLHPVKAPLPDTLKLHTLAGLCDYVKAEPTEMNKSMLIAHVCGPRQVRLVSSADGEFCERSVFADVAPPDGGKFIFNKFLTPEDFVIGMLSCFLPEGDHAIVLDLAAHLANEAVNQADDDGFGQTITVKRGVKAKRAEVKNPVSLTPFRSFADIDQPASEYILRFRGGNENSLPVVGLFEVDDGKWRLECIERIAAFLTEHMPEGVKIIR